MNIKSLAAEAKIIRRECKDPRLRLQGEIRAHLTAHGKCRVRLEARAAQLVYAYLRGVPRHVAEPNPRDLGGWELGRLLDACDKKLKRHLHSSLRQGWLDWFSATAP